MKHLSKLAALPFGFVVIAFAVANRGAVEVSLDPLPFIFAMPLYLVAMGGLVIGFLGGASAAWLAGHGARRGLRRSKARIASLESDLARLRAQGGLGHDSRPELTQARLPDAAA